MDASASLAAVNTQIEAARADLATLELRSQCDPLAIGERQSLDSAMLYIRAQLVQLEALRRDLAFRRAMS